jgi:tetrahydromethanopterin S-methyltransferase subunit G
MDIEEALEDIDEKYNLSGSEQAREIGRSVAHLRD